MQRGAERYREVQRQRGVERYKECCREVQRVQRGAGSARRMSYECREVLRVVQRGTRRCVLMYDQVGAAQYQLVKGQPSLANLKRCKDGVINNVLSTQQDIGVHASPRLALPHLASHCLTLRRTAALCVALPHSASRCVTLHRTLPHSVSHCLTLPHHCSKVGTVLRGCLVQGYFASLRQLLDELESQMIKEVSTDASCLHCCCLSPLLLPPVSIVAACVYCCLSPLTLPVRAFVCLQRMLSALMLLSTVCAPAVFVF